MALSDSKLWERVRRLEGKTVYTCTRQNPNKILRVTDNRVEIQGRTPVSRNGVLRNYETFIKAGRLTSGTLVVKRRVIMPILLRAVPDEIEAIKRSKIEGLSGIKLRQ